MADEPKCSVTVQKSLIGLAVGFVEEDGRLLRATITIDAPDTLHGRAEMMLLATKLMDAACG